jgi:iron complex outermembrane recepter protein
MNYLSVFFRLFRCSESGSIFLLFLRFCHPEPVEGQKRKKKISTANEVHRTPIKNQLICAIIPHAGASLLSNTFLSFFFLLSSIFSFSQEKDSTKVNKLDEVLVSATRVTPKTPMTFSDFSKKEIAKRNLGQDIPVLLNFLPSVVTTSDAGNGFGYTGIRVRGSDATRVNVTINGIPYNDSESQGTFWVNMPDFASSLQSVQLHRGVGTSTNGSSAFGASLNMLTDSYSEKSSGEINNSFGSFNSRKHTVKFSTGLMNNHFELAGRLSKLHSDGFIDRAFSDLKSYFLQGTFVGKTTLIKALVFGGTEKTYQSWFGLEDIDKLENDRTYNIAGMFTDANGATQFYDNQTDNYQQDHYQLHWNEKFSNNWNSNLALHYTKGKGYYENYKVDENAADFGLKTNLTQVVTSTDLINQQWLDNDFYGTTFSVNYKNKALDFILGGSANKYEGKHFGKVLWVKEVQVAQYGQKYYDNFATKTDATVFAKANYQITKKWNLFGDLQLRNVNYKANFNPSDLVNETYSFFNPKAGITYTINKNSTIYASYAKANREPNRTDFETGKPKPENLDDYELGWRFANSKTQININGFYMLYANQLVLTGALDDVGNPLRTNSGKSYRIGIEVDAAIKLSEKVHLKPNFTISENKNQDFYFLRDGVLQNLGNTSIAFSPNFIFGNQFVVAPIKNLEIGLLSKFVGDQYMGNIDSKYSKLKSYAVNDLNISYEITPKTIFKSITINALINNLFNQKYESNGYFYTFDDDYSIPQTITTIEGAGFYPQAGINFLIGLGLRF